MPAKSSRGLVSGARDSTQVPWSQNRAREETLPPVPGLGAALNLEQGCGSPREKGWGFGTPRADTGPGFPGRWEVRKAAGQPQCFQTSSLLVCASGRAGGRRKGRGKAESSQ